MSKDIYDVMFKIIDLLNDNAEGNIKNYAKGQKKRMCFWRQNMVWFRETIKTVNILFFKTQINTGGSVVNEDYF